MAAQKSPFSDPKRQADLWLAMIRRASRRADTATAEKNDALADRDQLASEAVGLGVRPSDIAKATGKRKQKRGQVAQGGQAPGHRSLKPPGSEVSLGFHVVRTAPSCGKGRDVAQLVERPPDKREAAGSSPVVSTSAPHTQFAKGISTQEAGGLPQKGWSRERGSADWLDHARLHGDEAEIHCHHEPFLSANFEDLSDYRRFRERVVAEVLPRFEYPCRGVVASITPNNPAPCHG